jgi:hypothetical protein
MNSARLKRLNAFLESRHLAAIGCGLDRPKRRAA